MVTRYYYCVTLTLSVILLPMNVTLLSNLGQAPVSRRAGRNISSTLLAGFCGLLLAAGISRAETVTNLEAVDVNGVGTWNGSFPIVLTGE